MCASRSNSSGNSDSSLLQLFLQTLRSNFRIRATQIAALLLHEVGLLFLWRLQLLRVMLPALRRFSRDGPTMEFLQPVAGADLYAIADDVARRSTLDAPRGRRQKQMRAGSHVQRRLVREAYLLTLELAPMTTLCSSGQLFSTLDCLVALAPPTPKLLRLNPPRWGAPAARVWRKHACGGSTPAPSARLRSKRAASGRLSPSDSCGRRLSPEDARRLGACQGACNSSKRRLDPTHGTSPQSTLSPAFAFWRPSPHSLAQLSTLTGRQPIVIRFRRGSTH